MTHPMRKIPALRLPTRTNNGSKPWKRIVTTHTHTERERERSGEPWCVELDECGAVLSDLLLEGGLRQGHDLVAVGSGRGDDRGEEEEEEAEDFAGDLRGRHVMRLCELERKNEE